MAARCCKLCNCACFRSAHACLVNSDASDARPQDVSADHWRTLKYLGLASAVRGYVSAGIAVGSAFAAEIIAVVNSMFEVISNPKRWSSSIRFPRSGWVALEASEASERYVCDVHLEPSVHLLSVETKGVLGLCGILRCLGLLGFKSGFRLCGSALRN